MHLSVEVLISVAKTNKCKYLTLVYSNSSNVIFLKKERKMISYL
jgi:hypothetical protein